MEADGLVCAFPSIYYFIRHTIFMRLTVASRFNCNGMGMRAIFTSFVVFKTTIPATTFTIVPPPCHSIESMAVNTIG
ncbi:hypothetical protein [Megasphaera sp.]|uniref:hypothetical protein n=1 Tax=Megasphaera sp. TaxID=2023260 RepID=UPI0040250AEA